jgi:hypothetical protein
MEAYQNYVDRGDIVELDYKLLKVKSDPILGLLKLLFQASSYQNIMLIPEKVFVESIVINL